MAHTKIDVIDLDSSHREFSVRGHGPVIALLVFRELFFVCVY